jgi:glucose/arabinose dehydrogenase
MRHSLEQCGRRRARFVAGLCAAGLLAAATAPSQAAAACSASPGYSNLVAGTPGLVSYWRLGETSGTGACDVKGASNGTYTGAFTLGQTGALTGDADTAVRFASGGQVTVPHATALDLNGAFSIEAWVKVNALPTSGWPGLFRKGHSESTGAGGGWLLWYDRTTRQLQFKRENVSKGVSGWTLGSPGSWSHVVVTYDGTTQNTLRFYLNGAFLGSTPGPTGGYPALTSTDPLQIGMGDAGTPDQTIDEPALYNVALTAAQVTDHYNAGVGNGTPSGSLPAGFQDVTVTTGLSKPVAMTWAPDGRIFVAEKPGTVRVIDAKGALQSTPILDISDHVNNYGDRGLLGIATDSDFATNHFLYLLYTYELNPLAPDGGGPMVSRLTRVTVNPDNTVTTPETVLLGSLVTGPCPAPSNTSDCIPSDSTSHSIGTVRADADGTLWVGSGDAADYNTVDQLAFRTYDEQSFAGKILHVDRDGHGLPGHPFCPTDANLDDVCTKLYAKGFRNPFRFTLRPGGGLVVGDVGWETKEEIDFVSPGRNYGWPCYEATIHTPGYQADPKCATEYAKEGTAAADAGPVHSYDHPNTCPCGSAVVGGPTYTGSSYPAAYQGSVFFGDYVQGFLNRLTVDGSGQVTGAQSFDSAWGGNVDIETAPNGDLVYVDPGQFTPGLGAIHRIVYTPSNGPPVARASATPTTGAPPLDVTFTGDKSSDPDGDILSYDWNFGDGSAHSSQANPVHTYTAAGSYTARLTVDDGHGHTDSATVGINVGGQSPPTATISAPADGSLYRDGVSVALRGSATDAQDGNLPDSALSWQVILHHGSHIHDLGTFSGSQSSFVPLVDHDADSYYEVRLTATDSASQTDTKTVTIRPETISLTLASSPSGAPLSYAGIALVAPATRTAAIGFRTTITAADTFAIGKRSYKFSSWSDGGAIQHNITVPASNTTLTATYRRSK